MLIFSFFYQRQLRKGANEATKTLNRGKAELISKIFQIVNIDYFR